MLTEGLITASYFASCAVTAGEEIRPRIAANAKLESSRAMQEHVRVWRVCVIPFSIMTNPDGPAFAISTYLRALTVKL